MKLKKFSVTIQNPNNGKQIAAPHFGSSKEMVEADVNLLWGTGNIISIEPDNSPCKFDLWYDGKLPGLGSFDVDLYRLYMVADNGNKEKLAGAFPLDFVGTTF